MGRGRGQRRADTKRARARGRRRLRQMGLDCLTERKAARLIHHGSFRKPEPFQDFRKPEVRERNEMSL